MKQILLGSLLMLLPFWAGAQNITLYGLQEDGPLDPNDPFATNSLQMVQMNPYTGDTDSLFLVDNSFLVAAGSSTFNDQDRIYVYWGLDDNHAERVYQLDMVSNTTLSSPITSGRPIELEYDLQYGVTYGLQSDPFTNEPDLVRIDLNNGSTELISTIDEVKGVVINTSTFNSNEGHYIFIGVDEQFDFRIYTLDVDSGEILSNPQVSSTEGNLLGFLEYDIQSDGIFGLNWMVDSSDFSPVWQDYRNEIWVTEIDPDAGTSMPIGDAPVVSGYSAGVIVGGVTFDHESQTMILSTIDADNGAQLSMVDVTEVEVFSQIALSESIYELQCDNLGFIEGFFAPSSVNSAADTALPIVSVFPNPSTGPFTVQLPAPLTEPIPAALTNASGALVWQGQLDSNLSDLAFDNLIPGAYYLQVQGCSPVSIIIR